MAPSKRRIVEGTFNRAIQNPPSAFRPRCCTQHFSRKNRGSFWIAADNTPLHTLFIAESAIDALSAFSLAELKNPGTIFLSTCGATSQLPAWLQAWTPKRIICAFDADDAGDEVADRLAAKHQHIRHHRPEGGKDWNEILAARVAEQTGNATSRRE